MRPDPRSRGARWWPRLRHLPPILTFTLIRIHTSQVYDDMTVGEVLEAAAIVAQNGRPGDCLPLLKHVCVRFGLRVAAEAPELPLLVNALAGNRRLRPESQQVGAVGIPVFLKPSAESPATHTRHRSPQAASLISRHCSSLALLQSVIPLLYPPHPNTPHLHRSPLGASLTSRHCSSQPRGPSRTPTTSLSSSVQRASAWPSKCASLRYQWGGDGGMGAEARKRVVLCL